MSDKTRVVHVRDKVPGAVYVGRAMPRQGLKGSPFTNPFKVGEDGTRAAVIAMYADEIRAGLTGHDNQHLVDDLIALRGKPLACWCRHDGEESTSKNQCHGDFLLELLNEHTDDELRAMKRRIA